MATLLTLVNKHTQKLGLIGFFTLLGLFILSACNPTYRNEVDRLNELSYNNHYKNIDSTRVYAQRAKTLSADYKAGYAEALNNLAFANIIRMDYEQAKRQLDSITNLTDNVIEILIADVQQMRLCQRKSANKEFYEYYERAKREIRRIENEKENLSAHHRKRLVYAKSEFSIITSTYFYYMGLQAESQKELFSIEEDFVEKDTAQWLNYMYQIGAGGIITQGTKQEIAQKEWDYALGCYLVSRQTGNIFWEANAMQTLSEHLLDPSTGRYLMEHNVHAMKYINTDEMADSLLAGNLAQRALELFVRYGDYYQIAGAYRTLAYCYWNLGDYGASLFCFESALEDKSIEKTPDLLASIHEGLSITFSALNNKPRSDYHRNIYLDMQKKKQQNSELAARAEQLDRSSAQLNLMIIAVVVMIILTGSSLYLFLYLRRRKDKNSSFSLLLQPLQSWKISNDKHISELNEQYEEVTEQYEWHKICVAKSKKKYLENRSKIFLVNSITPLIDRMIREVNLLKNKQESDKVRHERYTYLEELTGTINDTNQVLTQWIKLQQGQLSMKIESFKVQELFDIVMRSRMSFQLKGITLDVKNTANIVKADKILTLFMINTLADNARKFTPQGGKVHIYSEQTDDYVEISVADTGLGIAENRLSHIFDHKVMNGHGFGLMNCKGIIEKYRKTSKLFDVCSIGVSSQEGRGSRFFFRLPKGVARLLVIVFMLLGGSGNICLNAAFKQPSNAITMKAGAYADSAYACNISKRYKQTIQYADSAIYYLNTCLKEITPNAEREMKLIDRSLQTPAEIDWLHEALPIDYQIVKYLRNEIAVAALALNDWKLYKYNNEAYIQLFKELSVDNTLGQYVRTMQRSKVNKNIAIILLLVLFAVMLVGYYFMYYRHILYFRLCVEEIERINEMILGSDSDDKKLATLNKRMASYAKFPPQLQHIIRQIKETLEKSIELNQHKMLNIELAQDENRCIVYEEQKLHVSNNVLDNCLSTLKHETMYYPSRIRQLVDQIRTTLVDREKEEEKLQAIDELLSYYKELHVILSTQAMRQLESVKLDCRVLTPKEILPSSYHYSESAYKVLGDPIMIKYLFETILKESGDNSLSVNISNKDNKYVVFDIATPHLHYRQLFEPSESNIPFMTCRQVARDNGESTNLRGCGIVAEPTEVGGSLIHVTLAKSKQK